MYGCGDRRPTGRPTARPDQSTTGSDEAVWWPAAAAAAAARLILNIDHVYSTQRDSLVITISTTAQHGPLASSIVPVGRGSALPRPLSPRPSRPRSRPVGRSVRLPVGRSLAPARIVSLRRRRRRRRRFVCNFIKWVSLVRSFVGDDASNSMSR